MPREYHFACPLPNGVHARPASALEEVARGFASEIVLVNERTGRPTNGKSVLAIVSADIRHNDSCLFKISGPDEEEAMTAITAFLRDTFPHCDDALPTVANSGGELRLPPGLRNADITIRRGTPVVPGIARGKVVQIGKFQIPPSLLTETVSNPSAEWQKLEAALQKLVAVYDRRIARTEKGIEGELLKALRSIARDSELRQCLRNAVMLHRRSAAGAIADAEAHFTAMLTASESLLLRERALDIQDVCFQILRLVYGNAAGTTDIRLKPYSLVVAESLTPSQFLALDRHFLKGLVLAHAGTTSHTVILARSFGIPTLTGVNDVMGAQLNGQEAVLDADLGALVTNLTDAARRYYAMEQRRLENRQRRLWQFALQPAATQDGQCVGIAANIGTADEAAPAFAGGAEGIGLFRTEMIFLDRDAAPGEAEQFEVYRRVLTAADRRPVVIRTFDVGGDKPLSYLGLPAEENPFLGCRALRLYPEFESIFRTQIRALVRASAHGALKVMLPMVATVAEARWARQIIAEEQKKCGAEGLAHDPTMAVGAMIEVPAAAFALDALCRELDFFSVGSNDLLQYFMAADRTNPRVAQLNDPLQPAFLRLLRQVVRDVHAHHKSISLCGEMGSQPRFLPLLVGLGFDQISVALPAIARLKAELAGLALAGARQLFEAALDCVTAGEVAALLEQFTARRKAPLLDPDLVILNVDAATKQEAIKQAVDQLYVAGRTEQPRAVEEAIWNRESTYTTGFGHGFAIPHCKTDAVYSNSLVLVKPRAAIAWDSLDGQPVRVVILLAVRESDSADEHLNVLARLARLLMHDDFRARLERETDPAALCAFLCDSIKN